MAIPFEDLSSEYAQAASRAETDFTALETARERQNKARTRIGSFVNRVVVHHKERVAFDSNEHLGMIEELRALMASEDQVPPID